MESGKLIHEYVLKVTKNRTISVNAYKMLASLPDSILEDSQYRNREGAYLLAEDAKKKGLKCKLSMTHYVAVLGKKLNADAKAKYLLKAHAKGLSANQLKKIVALEANDDTPVEDAEVVLEYDESIKKLKSALCQCLAHLSNVNRLKGDKTIPREITEHLTDLMDFATVHGFTNKSEPKADKEERKAA